jgi:ubiquinone biosynthesis protein UbiJ
MQDGEYLPQHLQHLATKLIADHDVKHALAQLRSRYPNLNTLRSALTKLKNAVISANVRHPSYVTEMLGWEERVKDDVVREIASSTSLQRLKEFYAFRDCSLRRQMHVQKKIKLGMGAHFFINKEDAEFVGNLAVAADFVHLIRLDSDEAKIVHDDQATKMKRLSETVVRVESADQIVANARRALKECHHKNALGIVVSIAIVTGRRMIEIMQKGQFTEDPTDRYSVLFSGQAKAGLQEIVGIGEDRPVSYSIPVLAPAKFVVNAVTTIRSLCNTSACNAKRINSIWCKKLNAHVRQNVHRQLGFHDMRTLYALTSFEAFKPHTYSINAWISKTLGHTGLNMSVSYTRMQVYGVHKIRRHHRQVSEDFVMEDDEV